MGFNIETPNNETLTKIDWFMQHSSREKRWEQSGVTDFYTGDGGWSDVEKNDNENFRKAWYEALNYIHSNNFNIEDIKNYQGE